MSSFCVCLYTYKGPTLGDGFQKRAHFAKKYSIMVGLVFENELVQVGSGVSQRLVFRQVPFLEAHLSTLFKNRFYSVGLVCLDR